MEESVFVLAVRRLKVGSVIVVFDGDFTTP
jgi:hypothetical protein